LGSLGRQRFVALTTWRGGTVAREAKALAPSACAFAARASMPRALGRRALEPTAAWLSTGGAPRIYYDDLLRRGVRSPDPHVQVDGVWLVRRLAPDCSRIGLHMLPRKRDEVRLLTAMGWETANLHLGTPCGVVRVDLKRRKKDWLYDAASRMADTVEHDWRAWRAHL
ncbi:MAG TPA: hypothetical protein VM736_02655, partial [Gemmatimonadales bacterium]|nr:hypothetical protein [Gemmatimonadales bacterium]